MSVANGTFSVSLDFICVKEISLSERFLKLVLNYYKHFSSHTERDD